MKKFLLALLLLPILTGCHLLPGNAEYFQKKVKPVPVAAGQPDLVESRKQAAQFVDRKINEAKVAAATTSADVSVQVPLAEAATVSGPLFMSLGPPSKPWLDSATNLASRVDHQTSILDKKVDAYAKKVEPLEGKKIEGTGLFQIGFFTQWALVLGAVALVWIGLKVYGLINPIVGAGTTSAGRVGSAALAKGIQQVTKGGEVFKKAVFAEFPEDIAKKIKEIFATAHRTEQDTDVQDLIRQLTRA